MKKQLLIILAMLLVAIPIFYAWTTEIYLSFGSLSNGFISFDGIKTYHIAMYLLFVINFLASYYVAFLKIWALHIHDKQNIEKFDELIGLVKYKVR
jgi:hypothetical protein